MVSFTCVIISSSKQWLILIPVKVPYHNCIHNHVPDDEPPGSKHVEDIKKLKY
jgi:hypothetical protein